VAVAVQVASQQTSTQELQQQAVVMVELAWRVQAQQLTRAVAVVVVDS
jgi:hypothetical protein